MVLSATAVKDAIGDLSSKALACQGPANQLIVMSIATAVSGLGPIPVVVTRLSGIVAAGETTAITFLGTKPYTEKSYHDLIFESFDDFVKVNQDLLTILIGKAGLAPNLLPYVGSQLASVLRQFESIFDTLAFELIDTCRTRATDLTAQKNSLDTTIAKAIQS